MRSAEEKGCYNHGPMQETPNSSAMYFEFHKGNEVNRVSHHRTPLGKPAPSKWDDAQKWLVGLSRAGERNQSKSKPRNSNADDLRLIAPVPQKEQEYSDSEKEGGEETSRYEAEMEKVECNETVWRINQPAENSFPVRSICLRDMGTEMTPIASQEPSRTATPIRATTPASRSPIHSGSSTPMRGQNASHGTGGYQSGLGSAGGDVAAGRGSGTNRQGAEESSPCKMSGGKIEEQARKLSPLESRAMAWDEAERAKYNARFKREEVKIQAWENHQIRNAELEMKKMEVKAEKMKVRAQERLANKLAATRRIAEEKRANAQAKLNEKALRISERADYIRRTGHVPSSFSFNFKLPSFCW